MSESPRTFGHIIDGKEVFEGEVKERRNPADRREVVAQYHDGTPDIMRQAITSAQAVFPAWARVPRPVRSEVIFQAAALIQTPDWSDRIANAMVSDVGKTIVGAKNEVAKTFRTLRHMEGFGTHGMDSVAHAQSPQVHMPVVTRPVGVAGAVGAFNFPSFLAALKIAPALVAGCPVVFKPSPAAPQTSALFVELMHAAIEKVEAAKQIGPGLVNLVQGGEDVVRTLAEDPRIQAFTFTGSTPVGTKIRRWLVERDTSFDLEHFSAEMGGLNAEIVMPDANFEEAIKAAVIAAFVGEGQRCTATKRLILVGGVPDDFIDRVVERTIALKIGPGQDSSTEVGPLVSEKAREDFLDAIRDSVAHGMQLVYGGEAIADGDMQYGNYVKPTILRGDHDNKRHRAAHEEVFGPIISVLQAKDFDDAVRIANGVDHKHAAGFWTSDFNAAFRFAAEVHAGMKHVNQHTLGGDEGAPFGGAGGATSYGNREMGPDCLRTFQVGETLDFNWGGKAAGGRAR